MAADERGPTVIVAPKFTREVWRRELLALGAIAAPDELCVLQTTDLGDESFRREARWFFVHYEIANFWATKLYQARPSVAILDEAHWIKNGRAKRSEGATMIAAPCKRRILLTGTPLENRPHDLWNLLTLACGQRTWGGPLDFRKRYCGASYNGYGYTDGEPTHVDELRARLLPYYLRRTAEQVSAEMPQLSRRAQVVDVPEAYALEAQSILDRRTAEELVRAVASGAMQGAVLQTFTRLRQLASRAKIGATVELVNNCINQDEHVVVFCWEREVAAEIASRVQLALLATGDHTQAERDQAVSVFQDSVTACAMVATYGAMREGVTLHRARTVVLHDLDWVLTRMLQAEARVHRISQKRACQAIWMVGKNTGDQLLAPVLEAKAAALSQMLGDPSAAAAATELDLARLAGVKSVEQQVDEALASWGGA